MKMYTTPLPHKPLNPRGRITENPTQHNALPSKTQQFSKQQLSKTTILRLPILVLLIVQLILILYFSNKLFCMFCTQVALCKKGGRVSSENHPDLGIERRRNPTAQRGPSWNHSADHPNVTPALRCHGNTFVAKYGHNIYIYTYHRSLNMKISINIPTKKCTTKKLIAHN